MSEKLKNPQLPKLPTTSKELYEQFKDKIKKPGRMKQLFHRKDHLEEFKDTFVLLTGNGNIPLAERVGELLSKNVHRSVRGHFANGEVDIKIPENVRGRDVFIMEAGGPNPNDRVIEIALTAAAARGADAKSVTLISHAFPYARQDRKTESRTPNSAEVMADIFTVSGVTRTLTVDIHSEQTMRKRWDNLYARPVLIEAVREGEYHNYKYAGPDVGSGKRTEAFSDRDEQAEDEIALVYKTRNHQARNESKALAVVGDVKDRDVVILVDDILDTGGTAINGAEILKEKGAKSVGMVATHAVLSEKDNTSAVEKIENSPLDFVIVTDTILQEEKTRREIEQSSKIEVVSVAPMLAVAILCYMTGDSIGERLIK